ncbi:MAG: PspC domain-containing protein [Pseudomonadales bacterium]|jgi:phage shock protein C
MSFRRIQRQRLMLDSSNKKFGGVCAGIGRYLDIAPFVVRIGAIVVLCIAAQPTLLAYGLAWAILSDGPSRRRFDDSEY